jgi:hypothetical protein
VGYFPLNVLPSPSVSARTWFVYADEHNIYCDVLHWDRLFTNRDKLTGYFELLCLDLYFLTTENPSCMYVWERAQWLYCNIWLDTVVSKQRDIIWKLSAFRTEYYHINHEELTRISTPPSAAKTTMCYLWPTLLACPAETSIRNNGIPTNPRMHRRVSRITAIYNGSTCFRYAYMDVFSQPVMTFITLKKYV